MGAVSFLLWAGIITSSIALIGYEIWNIIVVGKDMSNMARQARKDK